MHEVTCQQNSNHRFVVISVHLFSSFIQSIHILFVEYLCYCVRVFVPWVGEGIEPPSPERAAYVVFGHSSISCVPLVDSNVVRIARPRELVVEWHGHVIRFVTQNGTAALLSGSSVSMPPFQG